jgi:hypothetical protein
MYMDKLANGINPIDDTMAPNEDIINNVRLSRYFFFVSDVLRQVIESGGTKTLWLRRSRKSFRWKSCLRREAGLITQRNLFQPVRLQNE